MSYKRVVLILSFESIEIRDLCEDEQKLVYKFGEEISLRIVSRLSDLISASNLSDLPAHLLNKVDEKSYNLIIKTNYYLKFSLVNKHITGKNKLNRVKIIEINCEE